MVPYNSSYVSKLATCNEYSYVSLDMSVQALNLQIILAIATHTVFYRLIAMATFSRTKCAATEPLWRTQAAASMQYYVAKV